MNKKLINLIKIADKLDQLGLSDDADIIDSIIEDETDVIEVPGEEYDLLQDIYISLGNSLK